MFNFFFYSLTIVIRLPEIQNLYKVYLAPLYGSQSYSNGSVGVDLLGLFLVILVHLVASFFLFFALSRLNTFSFFLFYSFFVLIFFFFFLLSLNLLQRSIFCLFFYS